MSYVANGIYSMVGTFNGNPLSVAAGRAMLEEVATEEAYPRNRSSSRIDEALSDVIAEAGLPARVVSIGAKGCVTFSTVPVHDYRDFLEIDDRYNHAHWLLQHNGGVFLPPWGKTEQWLISVQHDDSDVERLLGNFERFARSRNRLASARAQPHGTVGAKFRDVNRSGCAFFSRLPPLLTRMP